MTDQPTVDPIGDTTPETAHALLRRHGLPEDVIDGALCLHAQELAAVQRREAAVWGVDTAAGKRVLATADLIDPTAGAHVPAVPVSSPPPDQTALRERIAMTLARTKLRPPYLHCLAMADAVLAELPELAEAHRLALSEALGLGTGAPWDAIHDRATKLGLPPLAEDPVAQRLGLVPPSVDRAAVLLEAADAVFALDYDVMVGEVGDENFGSMREAWDVGTIHATELLRRLAAEAQQTDTETQACAHSDGCDGECPCPPSCGCCTVTAAPGTETPNTARAAVYREVADRLTTDAHGMQPDWARIYKRDAAVKVREWAEQLDGEGRPTKKLPAS